MNNLKLYSEVTRRLVLQSEDELILFSAIDIERGRLFFASSLNLAYCVQLSCFQGFEAWKGFSVPMEVGQIDLEHGDQITSFDYLMEKEALVVGTLHGLIILHNVDTQTTEVIGRVDGGVSCMSPSPDGDMLGVVTGFGQLLLMTHDWDLLHETTLVDSTEGVDVSDETFSSKHMLKSSISWRGDGKYFATISECCTSSDKRIKVWERDSGALHATSELKPLTGSVLGWMPSGAKIAAVYDRKKDNERSSVIFFERNGLERSSFSVDDNMDAIIENLKWNSNSDLLATLVKGENYDLLRIWYCSNSHWYLKHEIRYSGHDGVKFMWHPTKPLELICWTISGCCTIYNCCWTTAVMDNSTSFVIDGSKILVTPLSMSLLPPPMYLFSVKFSSAVQDISFYPKTSRSTLAAVLSNGCLSIVELPEMSNLEELEGKEYNAETCSSDNSFGSFIHLTWLDSHTLLSVSHYWVEHGMCKDQTLVNGEGYYLQEIELFCCEDHVPSLMTCSGWHVKTSQITSLERPVVAVASDPAEQFSAFIQFDGGKIFKYGANSSVKGGDMKHGEIDFLSSCLWMRPVCVGDYSLQTLLFGLDKMGRLQTNGKILCNNCSSVSFYSSNGDQVITHLILATKQDLLFIVDINDILHGEVELKYNNFLCPGNKRQEEEKRKYINIWERGAKIVGVLHGDEAAVILQTTRGNLECIYPRKLVLASVINALVQRRFKDAMHMVRRHRIEVNIMIDYFGWQNFVQHAPEFVKQINNLNYLTEFICAIKKENIEEMLYKNYIALPGMEETEDVEARDLKGFDPNNKVFSVLRAIRNAIQGQLPESPSRELCILTTLAKSDPPALEEALERIKVIREIELSCSVDPRRNSFPTAEEALKHLLWLLDSEAVFEAALGLYDLNLAAIVALNSQKDPKEFLPFLQDLQCMSPVLMRYTIDLKLQRYENALKHIASAGDAHYVDFMNLMKENPHLFPLGLQLTTDPGKRNQILGAWGDYLNDSKCFEDAAITYLCCSNLEKALKAYRSFGSWSGVLTVAGLLKLGKEEIVQLAHELCEELHALGKPGEAAKIALEYCEDVNSGVGLLVSAREWEEALRTAFLHHRVDLVSEIKKASLECGSLLINEYEEGLEKIGKYLTRYLAVRQRRLLLAAKLQSEDRAMDDLDDTASQASSNFSGMSAYTKGTRAGSTTSSMFGAGSKTKESRRQRNKGKIRPGSPGEEIALVEHLKGMSLSNGAMRELQSLLVCLVMLGEEEIARKLQRAGETFQLSQIAAVKLAADTLSTNVIDEERQTLEHYLHKARVESRSSEAFSWRCNVFVSP